ncbi:MAG TPA: zinc-dependent alcohol dehydrogenase family protein [Pyrinomonadaceae bacterium]
MKAVAYHEFSGPLTIEDVASPAPPSTGVVIEVRAAGICRSDWHGWMGNDPDIKLPHVPGHEFAGVIAEVGADVKNWQVGDRVTLPFVCGCGECEQCLSGNQQVCDRQFQPGFTNWGAFAEYVAVDYANNNLVRLPDEMEFATAAALGCRFITAFRAVVDQAMAAPGQFVAVHGCGGIGLSAIIIANAVGAVPIAVDIDDDKLEFARTLGAALTVNSRKVADVAEAVSELTAGGAHVSIDALGSHETFLNSVNCLRKRGRHVQVGIMDIGEHKTPLPVDRVIARELEIFGSHGMQAHRYPAMFEMIADGRLRPHDLIGRTISLDEAPQALADMNSFSGLGITVIDRFF